jgi:hypothetical protein
MIKERTGLTHAALIELHYFTLQPPFSQQIFFVFFAQPVERIIHKDTTQLPRGQDRKNTLEGRPGSVAASASAPELRKITFSSSPASLSIISLISLILTSRNHLVSPSPRLLYRTCIIEHEQRALEPSPKVAPSHSSTTQHSPPVSQRKGLLRAAVLAASISGKHCAVRSSHHPHSLNFLHSKGILLRAATYMQKNLLLDSIYRRSTTCHREDLEPHCPSNSSLSLEHCVAWIRQDNPKSSVPRRRRSHFHL